MTPLLLVQGTHAWGRSDPASEWWNCRSTFCVSMEAEGFSILGAQRPFVWDTDLDGVGWLQRRNHKKHINWEAAGQSLGYYLWPALARTGFNVDEYVPLSARNIVAHSHAMQVVAYACSGGLVINRLLTIGSPVREDMLDVYAAARPRIGDWMHVHSDGTDRTQWLGTLFDGKWGIVRALPASLRVRNVQINNVGHSRLLNDVTCFPYWRDSGLLDFLKGN